MSSFPSRARTRRRAPITPELRSPHAAWRMLAAAAVVVMALPTAVLLADYPIGLALAVGVYMALIVALGSTGLGSPPVSDDELLAVADAARVPARLPGRGRHALVPPSDTDTTLIPQVTA